MDGAQTGGAAEEAASAIVRTAETTATGDVARDARALSEALGDGPFSLIAIFAAPSVDLAALSGLMEAAHDGAAVIGCTTAGEITSRGYAVGEIGVSAFPTAYFEVRLAEVADLGALDAHVLSADILRARAALEAARPDWGHEFGFLMVDGLSLREDALAAALSKAMGATPFFGGSAGDGLDFRTTRIAVGGRARDNAAVLALVRTVCPVRIFKIDHLNPTGRKMVVTGADPSRRTVREINAEPAAKEYARILGKDPEQLSPFTFAAHPVLVRIGDQNHVRAIQQVAPNGDLVFFSAIEEGLVLTLAEADDIAAHLDRALAALDEPGPPAAVIACDCVLRRLEAEQTQATAAVSRALARRRVIGFNTYGEQINGVHVNQTLTGIAVYPPAAD